MNNERWPDLSNTEHALHAFDTWNEENRLSRTGDPGTTEEELWALDMEAYERSRDVWLTYLFDTKDRNGGPLRRVLDERICSIVDIDIDTWPGPLGVRRIREWVGKWRHQQEHPMNEKMYACPQCGPVPESYDCKEKVCAAIDPQDER